MSTSTRGRKSNYSSQEERRQARNARDREKYQKKQLINRAIAFHNVFQAAPGPVLDIQHPIQPNDFPPAGPRGLQPLAGYDEFAPPQIDNEFEGLLPLPSPSLGSASMDISEIESCELHINKPIEEGEDADFPDIDDLVPDVGQSEVEKLAIRLTNQLVQFQGCCRDCHGRSNGEHADEHRTHYGLQAFLRRSEDGVLSGCPDVLGSGQIAPHDDDLAGSMTPAQKRWVFSGIHPDDPEERPAHICLQEEDIPCQTARVSFDIDSITAFCYSLGVAKGGIRWNFIQMPVSDLQSGLHLARRRVQFFDSHGHFHSIRIPVNEFPHYTAGRLIGFEDVSLYFLFPRLYREGQTTSRLLDDDFQKFTNQVLLPALYRHYDSSQVQHYPSSYQHAKYNSTARGVEGRSRKVDTISREQRLMHFVPPDQLHVVWETIQETIEQPGLQQFKDVTIFLHVKNLKTLIKGFTWEDMMTRLQKYWGEVVDEAYISNDFYFDIGKETCPRQTYLSTEDIGNSLPAEILLWKKCCLDSYYNWCWNSDATNPCKQTLYPMAMLGDTVSMGVEPCSNSQLRAGGLLYSQFYSSVKEVFAAGNQYPFTNTAIETLALDPQLRKTWQHVGAGLSHDPVALIKAYLYAKARCHHGIQGSIQKSFGVREEHRVSAALFNAIDRRLGVLNLRKQRIAPASEELPYTTHPTKTVLSWYQWNINKFCLGFEMVYSLSGRQWVTWEHTRVMLMFLRCLRFSYGGGHPKEAAGCWRDVRYAPSSDAPDGFRRTEGLGFQVTMPQYGYAWFLEKLDWETMTFKTPHGQYMLFNNPSMQQAYHARYSQIRDVREDFIRVNKIQQLMQQFEGILECQVFLEEVLRQICLCAFRKDVFQHIKHLVKKECVEDALAGKVPLCWASVNRILRPRHSPAHLVRGKRLAVQSIDVLFAWLWEWKGDHFQRKHWGEKPYRLLYQRSFETITLMTGKNHAREWKQKLKSSFVKSHWLLPYPQGDRFMKHQRGQQQVCWWSSYHAGVHAYYQQQEERHALPQPFPASHTNHYPLEGWRLSSDSIPYMPYEIQPEHDLADLSESVVYEQVAQLAAERQLVQELGVLDDNTVLNAAAMDLEVYCINVGLSGQSVPLDRVERVQRELDREREKHQSLTYQRRRTRSSPDSEEDIHGDVTSDEEQLDLCTQRQKKVVDDKAAELGRLLTEEAEAEGRRKRLLQEKQQERRQLAEAEARRQHRLLIRRQRLLIKQRLEEIAAREQTLGLRQASAWSSSRSRRVLGRTRIGGIGEYKAGEDYGKVEGRRVVLGELDVRAFLGSKSKLI
jgi:hypothetical protein